MRWLPPAVTAATSAVALAALAWWLQSPPAMALTHRIPDPANAKRAATAAIVDIKGKFQVINEGAKPTPRPTAYPSWPHFRGPDHNNVVKNSPPLLDSWPTGGPPVVWSLDLGEGYASPVVHDGRFYILDYDEEKKADCLRCFLFKNAKEVWRRWYRVKIKRNHGISRTVPATDGKYVVTLGPKCHVLCADAKNGDFKWGIDLVREYGSQTPQWYAGQCPIIKDGKAILAPSGKEVMMMAVDCATGQVVWKTPNPKGWKMSHSSIIPMKLLGTQMYVYFASGGAVGVSLDGKVLWQSKAWAKAIVAPSPIQVGDDQIFMTSGYGAGSILLRLKTNGSQFDVEAVRTFPPTEFACEQQTPILYNDHLYTIMPKDGAERKNLLVCMDLNWKTKWMSSTKKRFGLGPFLVADDKIFLLDDKGELTMVRALPDRYEELARADVLPGNDSWGPMALVEGRLILRDLRKMICLDLRESHE